ncbi:MAG: SGNH/GDSL hydrolase family protein [Bacillus sp. (in: firmicutes)]
MKKTLPILSIIACVAILIAGQLYWNQKITVIVANDNVSEETNKGTEELVMNDRDTLISYTSHWPKESVNTFQEHLEAGDPFKIAFLGSNALGEGNESWPEIVKASLNDTFGDHIVVSTFSYDLTSTDFLNEDKVAEVIEEQPNLIFFEPFTLKDNGEVGIDDSLENTSTVMAAVKESLPETVVILQPPHPLYNANFYPNQVQELQQFAEENGITYLNHWGAWPDQKSKEIKEYITKDSSQPSGKGHQLWAEYLINYFIAK